MDIAFLMLLYPCVRGTKTPLQGQTNKLKVTVYYEANHTALKVPKSSTPSQALAKIPTFSLLSLLKAWWMSSYSPQDHHGSCQHSQSALISSHTASKLCGHCGLALQCVFVSCGHHVVSFSKEPAILYISRTVAQCAPCLPLQRVQELMLGNSRVYSVWMKRREYCVRQCTSLQWRLTLMSTCTCLFSLPSLMKMFYCKACSIELFTQHHLPQIPFANIQTNWLCSEQKCYPQLNELKPKLYIKLY